MEDVRSVTLLPSVPHAQCATHLDFNLDLIQRLWNYDLTALYKSIIIIIIIIISTSRSAEDYYWSISMRDTSTDSYTWLKTRDRVIQANSCTRN